jgi:ABC-2 type transport system permease protein
MYVSLSNIRNAVSNVRDIESMFLYLKLLTTTDGSMPPFHAFLSFLGPLLGIALGFDAINSEQNNGTLIRIMAQPIYRDNLILAKFVSPMIILSYFFLALALLMIGAGIFLTGVLIQPDEVLRIFSFVAISVVYVGFWLSLSILLSIMFRQPATSALTAIGIWLFLTVFYQIAISMFMNAFVPKEALMTESAVTRYQEIVLNLLRLAPGQLYSEATTTLLMPSVRSLGPLTMEQMAGAVPSVLSFKESLMVVWPQVSGLIAATVLCFAWSYYLFMRREIRS